MMINGYWYNLIISNKPRMKVRNVPELAGFDKNYLKKIEHLPP